MDCLYQVCLICIICIKTVNGFRNDFWIVPELANKMCPTEDTDFEYTISPSFLSCVYACMRKSTCTSIFYKEATRKCMGCTFYYGGISQTLGDFSGTVHATLHPDCGWPDGNAETTVTVSPDTKYGAVATYECLYGHYVVSGDFTRTCEVDGTWSGTALTCAATTCNGACTNSVGDVRLCAGSSQGICHPKQGRIEVFHLGEWGTVCDDNYNADIMNVTCKPFGYTNGGEPKADAYYGEGVGTIWLDDVSCMGNETSLLYCNHAGWGVDNCNHGEDLGVSCY